jgi:hypothetical protein
MHAWIKYINIRIFRIETCLCSVQSESLRPVLCNVEVAPVACAKASASTSIRARPLTRYTSDCTGLLLHHGLYRCNRTRNPKFSDSLWLIQFCMFDPCSCNCSFVSISLVFILYPKHIPFAAQGHLSRRRRGHDSEQRYECSGHGFNQCSHEEPLCPGRAG